MKLQVLVPFHGWKYSEKPESSFQRGQSKQIKVAVQGWPDPHGQINFQAKMAENAHRTCLLLQVSIAQVN